MRSPALLTSRKHQHGRNRDLLPHRRRLSRSHARHHAQCGWLYHRGPAFNARFYWNDTYSQFEFGAHSHDRIERWCPNHRHVRCCRCHWLVLGSFPDSPQCQLRCFGSSCRDQDHWHRGRRWRHVYWGFEWWFNARNACEGRRESLSIIVIG